jgi:hypothetical protein
VVFKIGSNMTEFTIWGDQHRQPSTALVGNVVCADERENIPVFKRDPDPDFTV